ncbi:hypothetical protein KEM48_013106 [Puccinia striiformis f. sp. tritici PST-130]|nr:hypothetical protein KEM48_013106 [Puccinia striiformis f. sp. tritici PST-130]
MLLHSCYLSNFLQDSRWIKAQTHQQPVFKTSPTRAAHPISSQTTGESTHPSACFNCLHTSELTPSQLKEILDQHQISYDPNDRLARIINLYNELLSSMELETQHKNRFWYCQFTSLHRTLLSQRRFISAQSRGRTPCGNNQECHDGNEDSQPCGNNQECHDGNEDSSVDDHEYSVHSNDYSNSPSEEASFDEGSDFDQLADGNSEDEYATNLQESDPPNSVESPNPSQSPKDLAKSQEPGQSEISMAQDQAHQSAIKTSWTSGNPQNILKETTFPSNRETISKLWSSTTNSWYLPKIKPLGKPSLHSRQTLLNGLTTRDVAPLSLENIQLVEEALVLLCEAHVIIDEPMNSDMAPNILAPIVAPKFWHRSWLPHSGTNRGSEHLGAGLGSQHSGTDAASDFNRQIPMEIDSCSLEIEEHRPTTVLAPQMDQIIGLAATNNDNETLTAALSSSRKSFAFEKTHTTTPGGRFAELIRTHVATLFGLRPGEQIPPPASEAERAQWMSQPTEEPYNTEDTSIQIDDFDDQHFPYPNGPGHADASLQTLKFIKREMNRFGISTFRPDLAKRWSDPDNAFLWNFAVKLFIDLVERYEYQGINLQMYGHHIITSRMKAHVKDTWQKTYQKNQLGTQTSEDLQSAAKRARGARVTKLRRVRCDTMVHITDLKGLIPIVEKCCSEDESDDQSDAMSIDSDVSSSESPIRETYENDPQFKEANRLAYPDDFQNSSGNVKKKKDKKFNHKPDWVIEKNVKINPFL